jgi:hypothetical protein
MYVLGFPFSALAMSSEKVPMAPATLEINVHAEGRFTGLSMAMMITELLDAELLIYFPELDGGLFSSLNTQI